MTTDELWSKYDHARSRKDRERSSVSPGDVRNWRPPAKFDPRNSWDVDCAARAAANFWAFGHFWSKERFGLFTSTKGSELFRTVIVKRCGLADRIEPGEKVDPDSWSESDLDPWDWENRQALYEKYRRSMPPGQWAAAHAYARPLMY